MHRQSIYRKCKVKIIPVRWLQVISSVQRYIIALALKVHFCCQLVILFIIYLQRHIAQRIAQHRQAFYLQVAGHLHGRCHALHSYIATQCAIR